jgi:hypothetical protein
MIQMSSSMWHVLLKSEADATLYELPPYAGGERGADMKPETVGFAIPTPESALLLGGVARTDSRSP